MRYDAFTYLYHAFNIWAMTHEQQGTLSYGLFLYCSVREVTVVIVTNSSHHNIMPASLCLPSVYFGLLIMFLAHALHRTQGLQRST